MLLLELTDLRITLSVEGLSLNLSMYVNGMSRHMFVFI